MQRQRVAAAALVASSIFLATPAAIASAEDNAPARDELVNKVYDAWVEKMTTTSPTFLTTGTSPSSALSDVRVITDDPTFIQAAITGDAKFASKMSSVKDLSSLSDEDVKELTPAVTDDGNLVAVLPHGDVVAQNDSVQTKDVKIGVDVKQNGVSFPIYAAPGSLRLAYSTDDNSTGTAFSAMASPDFILSKSNLTAGADESSPSLSMDGASGFTPGRDTTLKQFATYVNNGSRDVTSIVEAFKPTDDADEDSKDGVEDGLVRINQSQSVIKPGTGTSEQSVDIAGQSEGPLFVSQRIVDHAGNEVVPVVMDKVNVTKPSIDVQASTSSGNSKLVDGKQTIYNEVALGDLTSGGTYQILVNLYQCGGPDDCTEIAAVNREIIPQAATRHEFFSVNVDADKLPNDDSTFEWTVRVYEGTGDVENMGDELVSVADHPDSQVLSKVGNSQALGSNETNVKHAEQITVNAQGEEEPTANENLEIGSERPVASMDQVRDNNDKLREQQDESRGFFTGVWARNVAIVLALTAIIIGIVNAVRNYRSRTNVGLDKVAADAEAQKVQEEGVTDDGK